MGANLIRDLVDVSERPTVVRLVDLEADDSQWISRSYHQTTEVKAHLRTLHHGLAQKNGTGVFLIGPYGSGKSHFLAFLVQELRRQEQRAAAPSVTTLSLVNFAAKESLESIICSTVGVAESSGDRRRSWTELDQRCDQGLVLVIDELSEFLRSKATRQAFNEDVRFLQFLGEWAQDHRLWIVAAMQEQIEHTGELESSLYRKIKDRFPMRLLLSTHHVRDLVADSILIKSEGYEAATTELVEHCRRALPDATVDLSCLTELYPIHPITLELLEEVRDLFSQTRGTVEFVMRQLLGDPGRELEPFLDRPWGELLTADAIVDHFADLFEVQPEFQALAQTLLPYYRRNIEELFPKEGQRRLAWQVIKLLMLVSVSPQREELTPSDAASWLLVRATTVQPERNVAVVERILERLVQDGRYVVVREGHYKLDLHDDSAERLAERLRREVADLTQASPDAVWEILVTVLGNDDFNPFSLPWDRWQPRRLRWHQHERPYAVWLGNGEPSSCEAPVSLCIRLPWGGAGPAPATATLLPGQLELDPDLIELAALLRLAKRGLDGDLSSLAERLSDERRSALVARVRVAFLEAELVSDEGRAESLRGVVAPGRRLGEWLDSITTVLLRRRFPSFERFAPSHGPLTKEAYQHLMTVAAEHDLGDYDGDDYVKLIREAYLVPMGLMSREGWYYQVAKNLHKHELVELVMPLLEHRPSPSLVYDHLGAPVYGLVPDQIHLLLIFLFLQGEIDLVKDGRSYRDLHPTLPLPIHYGHVELGSGLSADHLRALGEVAEAARMRTPRQWTVTAQRQVIGRLAELGERRRQALVPALRRIESYAPEAPLKTRLGEHAKTWETLTGSDDELRRFERFCHAAGSISRFAADMVALEDLPARLDRAVSDLKRLGHLFSDEAVFSCSDDAVRSQMAGLAPLPELADMAVVEQWLQLARSAWTAYCQAYSLSHDAWWAGLRQNPVWTWRAPTVASSRHLGLQRELSNAERLRAEVTQQLCRGCSDLEFRSRCRCGFDGRQAEISDRLTSLEEACRSIETAVEAFFAAADVRERVRRFMDEGLEVTEGLQAYLSGEAAVPEVDDLQVFDRVLAGVEVVREVPLDRITSLVGDRTWDREQLVAALARELEAVGSQRLRFSPAHDSKASDGLAIWCVEQSLRFALELPVESRGALNGIRPRPEWVSVEALNRLERLGLGEEIEDEVIGWLVRGTIDAAGEAGGSPLVRAALEVGGPSKVDGPAKLGEMAALLYSAHRRLWRLMGDDWLDRLGELAGSVLDPEPPRLAEVLATKKDLPWLIVDAFGLPLLGTLRPVIDRVLSGRAIREIAFASVSARTTTDAFYSELITGDVAQPFMKINVVDRLLHERELDFADLEKLASAELEVALGRLELDPTQGLLILADHGFRLDEKGRSFVHGGSSTLERVVPMIELAPVV